MPVPVAPATSPCLLSIASGIRIWVSVSVSASSIRPPSSREVSSKAYPGATAATTGCSGARGAGPGGSVMVGACALPA